GGNGPHIRFSIAAPAEIPTDPFVIVEEFKNLCGEGFKEINFASLWEQKDLKGHFDTWFGKMYSTMDYKNATVRPILARRTLSILSYALENTGYKDALIGAIIDGNRSCVDRIALSINQLEVYRKLSQTENMSDEKLFQLLKGCFIFEELERIAKEKMRHLQYVDEIEVLLAYQVEIQKLIKEPQKLPEELRSFAATLQLPLDETTMHFFGAAGVTYEDLKEALSQVKTLCEGGFLMDYLLRQTIWTKRLETQAEYVELTEAQDRELEEEMKESDYEAMGSDRKNKKQEITKKYINNQV
ncbi:MAG TPA: NEL-type E3 ubiquitin ligase domain-containing protein, partial [Candidatus Hodarchaeales archaeon]|nr:NEL-type E3 ubiquitin ligase domain-containing protein [Candidatus Hodarchaeales archaeon]